MDSVSARETWPWYDLVFNIFPSKDIRIRIPPRRHRLFNALPNEILFLISKHLSMEDIVGVICVAPDVGPAFAPALTISTETNADIPDKFLATTNRLKYWYTFAGSSEKPGPNRERDYWCVSKTHAGIVNSRTSQGIRALKGASGMNNLAVIRLPGVIKWVVLPQEIFRLFDHLEVKKDKAGKIARHKARNHSLSTPYSDPYDVYDYVYTSYIGT